ncbi:MAG: hypothetical protein ACI4PU_00170 [Intestinibacter sp.]
MQNNNFKSYLLSKCLIGYGLVNGIINAIIFYFMERGHLGKLFEARDIITDFAFTTFSLGAILALIVIPLIAKDMEKGKFKADNRTHKIEKYLPEHILLIALVVGLIACFISVALSAIVVYLFKASPLNITQMMIFKGIICSIAGAISGYLCIIKVAYRK